MNKTKKSTVLSVLSLVLCTALLIGATFAWFTDSVTSGSNQIAAGNLDLELYHTNSKVTTAESVQAATGLWNKDINGEDILWEPGVVSYETFTVKNVGTLALTYKLLLNQLADTDYNTVVSSDSSNGKSLKDVLYVHTTAGAAASSRPATKMADTDKTIAELLSAQAELLSGNLEAGAESDALTVYIYWPADSGNECNLQNGKTASDAETGEVGALWINLSITANATQYTFESDSFDNKYDAKANGDDTTEEDDNPYLTFSSDAAFTLGTAVVGWLNSEDAYLESSVDGETWTKWTGTELTSGTDNKIYLRGKGFTTLARDPYSGKYTNFTLSTSGTNLVDCSGNIMTLLDYENPASVEMTNCAFMSLFGGCALLKTAPSLPAMKLATYCYDCMFYGCTNLTTAPALPATDLTDHCYSWMFGGCSSLTQAPVLDSTNLNSYCYAGMFQNCTSLTQAPTLPAQTLKHSCYDTMFWGCNSLYVAECEASDSAAFVTLPSVIDEGVNPVGGMFKDTPNGATIGTDGTPLAGKSYKVVAAN